MTVFASSESAVLYGCGTVRKSRLCAGFFSTVARSRNATAVTPGVYSSARGSDVVSVGLGSLNRRTWLAGAGSWTVVTLLVFGSMITTWLDPGAVTTSFSTVVPGSV